MRIERLPDNPIITPDSDPSIGDNVNGPSLIRVPDWVERPLGRYYLYFAHHKGTHIRLAYADQVEGPWTVHPPGSLAHADSLFPAVLDEGVDEVPHIASPDVIVDDAAREIRLYYHGALANAFQLSRVATSRDGLAFTARDEILGMPYLRMFRYGGLHYSMGMPGIFYRSQDGLTGFEQGPRLFERNMRHAALWVRGDELTVLWTRVTDAPECILCSRIDLSGDWQGWKATDPVEVLRAEEAWEGAELPARPSVRGAIYGPANELRDPALFHEQDRTYLVYAVAGESGLALARVYDA